MSFNSNEYSLTYPQCDMPASEYVDQMKRKLDEEKILYLACVQEHHKDASLHLHSHIQFKKSFHATKNSFDCSWMKKVFHPNIQKTKSTESWNEYIQKEGTVITYGVLDPYMHRLSKKATKQEKLTNKDLLEGDVIKYIEEDRLSLFSLPSLMNARKIYGQMKVIPKDKLTDELPLNWKDLILKVFQKEHNKQRHYWMFSSMPNKGKTTYLKKLEKIYCCSRYSIAEKYQSLNQNSEILIFDEYGPGNCIKIMDLNQICDGDYKFPVKGCPPVQLDCPLVIIMSNYSILNTYKNSMGRVEARFNEICLDNLEFI